MAARGVTIRSGSRSERTSSAFMSFPRGVSGRARHPPPASRGTGSPGHSASVALPPPQTPHRRVQARCLPPRSEDQGETREGVADLPASRRRRAPAGGLGRRAGHASLVFQQVAWSSPTRASCEDRRAVTMHFAALAGVGSSSRIRSGMSVANVRVVDESAALAETGLALRGRVVTPSEAHVARRFPFRPCPRTLPSRPLLARGGRPGHGDARACYGPRRRTSGAPRGAGSDLARVMKDRTSVGPGEEGDGARGGDRC